MEDFIESKNYKLTKKEETEIITDINNLLKNFEKLLKLTTFEMNSRKIIDASLICESMLNLLLKKEGYLLKDNTNFSEIIIFCSNNNLLPVECLKFIDIIRIYNLNIEKGLKTTNELTSSFLEAFVFYISWFKSFYSKTYSPKKEFKIDKCCFLINSKNINLKFNNINESIRLKKEQEINDIYFSKKHNSDFNLNTKDTILCRNCGQKNDEDSKFCINCGTAIKEDLLTFKSKRIKKNFSKIKEKTSENEELQKRNEKVKYDTKTNLNQINQEIFLKQLAQQNESLKIILETVLNTHEIVKDINAKIDIITNNLTRIQSQSEKLIKSAWSEEEIDRIIQVHTNECVENILEYQNDIIKDNQYDKEKEKLLKNFGASWEKLSNESKNLLITSKFMFSKLEKINENMDYSGICVLVTKALEIEIFDRFFKDFLKYLDNNYNKDYSKYPTALLFRYKQPLYPERFTMGNIAFVLCYTENYNDTSEQIKNNKSKLLEYCKSCIFSNYSDEEIGKLLNSYASSIEDIRIRFRNPSAHRGYIKKTTAEECFKLVIDVERLLVKMLDSFDY